MLLSIILAGQLFVIIFGLYYVLSALYFSRDVEILVPLPLEPLQVMLSKFAVILVNEYLTLVPLVLPLFIYYGILANAGPGYWRNALAVYLLLPVILFGISIKSDRIFVLIINSGDRHRVTSRVLCAAGAVGQFSACP